ncbi:hypothetical protein XSR1_590003 [Xenorhabdus szentirmaii DSM 16338]|uniref:Uncharacterized protein n=1 Tax=Xenorhabdus szentirmaii DSM 16338 TaxID=1427518 RepID=W1J2G8_9GAMM|nr:hypothetical protein XSR1_590003 [Xenorhabdus szentirmaii DSM 16338]
MLSKNYQTSGHSYSMLYFSSHGLVHKRYAGVDNRLIMPKSGTR